MYFTYSKFIIILLLYYYFLNYLYTYFMCVFYTLTTDTLYYLIFYTCPPLLCLCLSKGKRRTSPIICYISIYSIYLYYNNILTTNTLLYIYLLYPYLSLYHIQLILLIYIDYLSFTTTITMIIL